MRGSQCGNCYINKKNLICFKNGKLFYVILKSHPSLLKSPEFMTPGILKCAYNTPALKPPSLLLGHSRHNFNETTSSDQIHILQPSPLPNFSAFALHCSFLNSSIYTCSKFFHVYQNYDKDVISVFCSNYQIILSYQISNVKNIYIINS